MRPVAILLILGLAACEPSSPPPPGYSGPLPSPAAQSALAALAGKTYADTTGSLSARNGSWTVVGPLVGPGGMVLVMRQGNAEVLLPIQGDGDAADIHLRVIGSAHPSLAGPPSAPYVKAWAAKR